MKRLIAIFAVAASALFGVSAAPTQAVEPEPEAAVEFVVMPEYPTDCSPSINRWGLDTATWTCWTGTGWMIPYAKCKIAPTSTYSVSARGTPRVKSSNNVVAYASVTCPSGYAHMASTSLAKTNL